MKKKIFLIHLVILLYLSGCTSSKMHRSYAKAKIETLKNGMLLVRLQSAAARIAKLEELGHHQDAGKMEAAQREENQRIATTFQEHFDFCPVYFFYSHHSKAIRERLLDNILMNENLEGDSSLMVDRIPFFIAEFGWIGDSDVGLFLPGLVVKDDQFVPLLKPFPHFVRTTFMRRKVRVEKAVAILNKRLHRFYEDR